MFIYPHLHCAFRTKMSDSLLVEKYLLVYTAINSLYLTDTLLRYIKLHDENGQKYASRHEYINFLSVSST